MSGALENYLAAVKAVRVAAAEVALAELQLDGEKASITAMTDAEAAVAVAAKKLTRAVEVLPMRERQIKGWIDA